MNKYTKYIFSLLVIAFVFMNSNVKAHAVQLGYCTSCNGDLRIWIEHWHSTEDPSTTSLDVTITVNGVPTTIIGAPDTSVQNIPFAQLPGCFNPINFFASCPNDANQYNDWVAYDFPGVSCNVPISVVVNANSSTTVFTQDCGGMYPASTGTFTIPCATNQLPDIDTCAGNIVGPFAFPAGNTWTNDNPAIGLAANGAGDVPAFMPANNPTTQVANITVTNSCGIATFTITVFPAPESFFIANVGCPGQPVGFTDQSTSPGGPITTWTWDLGDGSPIFNGQNPPPHTYPPGGPFNVTLTTTTANGCTHDTIIPVDPLGGIVADFTAPSVCEGNPTIFTDASIPIGGIASWAWDFDNDGVIDNIIQNPNFTFPSAGTHNVVLHIVGTAGCSDSVVIPVVVNPNPVAGFTATDVCFTFPNVFTDISTTTAGTQYQWNFGDGLGISALQNPTYTYTNPGGYLVTLTLTTDSGCVNTITDSVFATTPPTAAFTPTNVCENVVASFTDNSTGTGSSGTWSWDFGDGVGTSTNQNPTYSYLAPGQYNVQLIVSSGGGCLDTIVQPIDIYPMPVANYSIQNVCFGTPNVFGDLSNISSGTITNWDWTFGNSNTSTAQNPSETYLNEGVYNTQLIITSDNGCKDTLAQTLEVWPLPVVNFNPTEVCLNDSTQFNDLSTISNTFTTNNNVQWNWDFDGLGSSNIQNPSFIFTSEGTVVTTLIVTSDRGCVDTATLNVTVNPLPVVNFGSAAVGCAPVCVNFTNTSSISTGSILSYAWDFGDGSGAGGQNPSYCFQNQSRVSTKSFDVSLTATSDKGCVTSATIANMVTAYPIPYADFTIDPEITDVYNPNISFFDASQIASSWTWDFGDGNGSIVNNPSHQYPDTAESYIVSLYIENIFGCTDTVRREVIIRPAFAIWIPNVFTPDGDGINDFFYVQGFGLKEIETLVFDRWGAVVFEGKVIMDGEEVTESEASKWDGTYRGKSITVQDVFVYKVRVKDVFNEYHDFIGKVTLIK